MCLLFLKKAEKNKIRRLKYNYFLLQNDSIIYFQKMNDVSIIARQRKENIHKTLG